MTTIIKNGTLITASETFEADILIEGETISQIGQSLQHPSADIIDATGKLILPGGIDPHVHLDLPMFGTVSSDDHYTGHKAAAFGGTTTVMDFVVLEDKGFQYSVDIWMKMAEKAAIDYSFHMNLTKFDDQIAKVFDLDGHSHSHPDRHCHANADANDYRHPDQHGGQYRRAGGVGPVLRDPPPG